MPPAPPRRRCAVSNCYSRFSWFPALPVPCPMNPLFSHCNPAYMEHLTPTIVAPRTGETQSISRFLPTATGHVSSPAPEHYRLLRGAREYLELRIAVASVRRRSPPPGIPSPCPAQEGRGAAGFQAVHLP